MLGVGSYQKLVKSQQQNLRNKLSKLSNFYKLIDSFLKHGLKGVNKIFGVLNFLLYGLRNLLRCLFMSP